jgi:hypothetical protein
MQARLLNVKIICHAGRQTVRQLGGILKNASSDSIASLSPQSICVAAGALRNCASVISLR